MRVSPGKGATPLPPVRTRGMTNVVCYKEVLAATWLLFVPREIRDLLDCYLRRGGGPPAPKYDIVRDHMLHHRIGWWKWCSRCQWVEHHKPVKLGANWSLPSRRIGFNKDENTHTCKVADNCAMHMQGVAEKERWFYNKRKHC